MTPILRYMGAFGKAPDLKSALDYEMARKDEVAAMSACDEIEHAGIALIMRKSSVIRKNRGDVWSVRNPDGTLSATRSAVKTHQEFWCKGGRKNIGGVVVTRAISATAFETVRHFCATERLPLYTIKRNGVFTRVAVF